MTRRSSRPTPRAPRVALLIPARLASTRLPGKLLLAATGRPLLAHVVERARAAQAASRGLITRVLVAADDERLCAAARAAGAEAVLTSPAHRSGTDRIAEAAARLAEPLVVNLQADEPEVRPEAILALARLLGPEEPAPMGTLAAARRGAAAERLLADPAAVKVVRDAQGYALYFSRAPIPYRRDAGGAARALLHLGLYAYRREFLLGYARLPRAELEETEKLEQLRALAAGCKIRVALVAHAAQGVDTPEDYAAFVRRWRTRAGRR